MAGNITELFSGSVLVKFGEANHRYTVSLDNGKTWDYKPGVTGVLNLLAKPALMMWPMDEALKYLFGQKFAEVRGDDGSIAVKPLYSASDAFLQAGAVYTDPTLQQALETARAAHTLKRDKGGDIGKLVHAMIESFLTGVKAQPAGPTEANKAYFAFIKWYNEAKPKVLGTEQIVYSRDFGYCGTFDALLAIDGKTVLVDFKTSNYSRTAPKGIYADNFIQLGGYALAYEEEFGKGTIDDLLVVNASKQGVVNTCYASELDLDVTSAKTMFMACLNLNLAKAELERRLK